MFKAADVNSGMTAFTVQSNTRADLTLKSINIVGFGVVVSTFQQTAFVNVIEGEWSDNSLAFYAVGQLQQLYVSRTKFLGGSQLWKQTNNRYNNVTFDNIFVSGMIGNSYMIDFEATMVKILFGSLFCIYFLFNFYSI